MRKTVLDKSIIYTSFACAVATFACGFVFCMAIISNSSGCYLLIKDFWKITRGYSWYQSLRNLTSDQILLLVAVIGLLLFSVSMITSLFQFLARRRRQKNIANLPPLPEPEPEPVLPSHPIVEPFVGENEVASKLQSYRRDTEAQSWEKLNSLDPSILAKYLKKEYPQVSAIVLSKLAPQKSAQVLSLLSGGVAAEIVAKMMELHSVDAGLAGTIGRAIVDGIAKDSEQNTATQVANILNYLDPSARERIMAVLESTSPSTVSSLQERPIMFTDLARLPIDELKQVVARISEPRLVMALRGAAEGLRNHFYAAMPQEQADVIRQALLQLGPIKFSDIENAQQDIASICQNMFANNIRGI